MSVDREPVDEVDVVIVGAGFAGLYSLYAMREMGLSVRGFEAGDGIGGTWFWNRYPGLRCDVNSLYYCYSFSDEVRESWTWTERNPAQAEILAYLDYVADKLNLRDHIQLSTRVERAVFDEASNSWEISTDRGERVRSQYAIMAVGCLSDALIPQLPGIDGFTGGIYHTAAWPHPGPDFSGSRVGVVGTGSSGVQAIPKVAEVADQVVVYQRTANYVFQARNAPLDPEVARSVNDNYAALREEARNSPTGVPIVVPEMGAAEVSAEERDRIFQQRWDRGGVTEFVTAFNDVRRDPVANEMAADFLRRKIREAVTDPETAELLCPKILFGAKRPQCGTDYYETFNRPNVTLVDISAEPIDFVPNGIRVGDREVQLDAVVLATGFDAFTGAYKKIDIRGRGGVALRDRWAEGPRTYLGLSSAGFPNLFMITGPQSPSVLGNVVVAIEQHVEWIVGLIAYARSQCAQAVEVHAEHERRWVEHVNEVGSASFISTSNSWYLGANVPGKPRVFLPFAGGYGTYRQICDEVAADGYRGFDFTPARPGE